MNQNTKMFLYVCSKNITKRCFVKVIFEMFIPPWLNISASKLRHPLERHTSRNYLIKYRMYTSETYPKDLHYLLCTLETCSKDQQYLLYTSETYSTKEVLWPPLLLAGPTSNRLSVGIDSLYTGQCLYQLACCNLCISSISNDFHATVDKTPLICKIATISPSCARLVCFASCLLCVQYEKAYLHIWVHTYIQYVCPEGIVYLYISENVHIYAVRVSVHMYIYNSLTK